jgi:RHS repeat-associated protein
MTTTPIQMISCVFALAKRMLILLLVLTASLPAALYAQMGNNNPTGPSGQFFGNVTTGCSYDPFTGNATRAVVDMVVAGSVGSYPLAFSRIYNSRSAWEPDFQFGGAGAWRHSYAWEIESSEESTNFNFRPTEYTVNFPDGRSETFAHAPTDAYFRALPGIRERFIPMDNTSHAYLVLADGGKVRFLATRYSRREWIDDSPPSTPPPEWVDQANLATDDYGIPSGGGPAGGYYVTYYGYTYRAEAIIDPYGLETQFSYNSDGSLHSIQEPGGRWIQLAYLAVGYDVVIDHILASDGRTVQYNYNQAYYPPGTVTYTYLDNVVYYPDPTNPLPAIAHYSYQGPNAGNPNNTPLLATADDPMYVGPMKKISYTYASGTNADQSLVVAGQVWSENSGTTGQPVSIVQVPTATWRSETRGDGPSRTFKYVGGSNLQSIGDYFGIEAHQNRDANGYLNQLTDRNERNTWLQKDPLTGNTLHVTYPQTPSDTDPGTPAGEVTFRYVATCSEDSNNCDPVNPYYLYSSRDEAGNTTIYHRDANKRVSQISYPDGASETFQYNAWGQIIYHQLKTGGWEFFDYDPNTHLLASYRDPYHEPLNHTGKPAAWYQYNARGWLSTVTDWRGAGPGDVNYTTEYDYNLRGQRTLVRHPVDPVATPATRYTVQGAYNPDGTLQSVTDENGHTTDYIYDDYKRVSSVTPPPADQNDPLPRTTFFYYDRNGGTTTDYTHTDANVGNMTTPRGNMVKTLYNANVQKWQVTVGTGSEAGTTTFEYDAVGNLKKVADPAGQTSGLFTEYFYDERNRLRAANDPISSDRNSFGYTMSWMYDAGGHKKSEQRANNQFISWDLYDAMNRLQQQSVQRDAGVTDVTNYSYDSAGNLQTFRDGRQKSYTYGYDLMGRQTSLIYPPETGGATPRSEGYHYDLANNMDAFTDREGAVQTFEYDNRNRQTHYSWNAWPLYTLHERWMTYDPVGNVKRSQTEGMDVSDFLYDWRNRKTSETQTPASRPSRTVAYTYDADSNRRTMTYPSGYSLTYDYNSRDQLWKESDPSGVVVTYGYDLSGNRTTRTLRNGTVTTYTPDAMNRIKDVAHYRGGTLLGRFDYNYDSVSRVKAVKRDFAKGDYYQYYLDDQLKTAQYDAWNVDLDSPWGAANATTLAYDASGNRTTQTNATTPSNSYSVNNLNQYATVNGTTPNYDAAGNLFHFNGWEYGYNRQNQLTDAVNGSTALYFYYDGLNRQILRYVGDANGGDWIFSAWDDWNLLEEYDINGQVIHSYVHGAATDELISRSDTTPDSNRIWYYQDAQGSTTHLADDSGQLKESYKYPPADSGAPAIFDGAGQPIPNSAPNIDNRFLYTGREYYRQGGFYDYRNRSYLPSLGRFLQPDPTGFAGDAGNLYRYCGNSTVNGADPYGLWTVQLGFSLNVQIGPFAGAFGIGMAFDGQGNVGLYRSSFGGVGGLGADIALTQGGMWSVNADSIYDLRGPFREGSATGGDEIAGTAVRFSGKGSNGQPVDGYGFFAGAGAGAGWTFGKSNTTVSGINIFTGQYNIDPEDMPAPGGTTWVDPSICPDCATTERVTVTGQPVPGPTVVQPGQTYSGPGGLFHLGSTGNFIPGPAFTVLPLPPLALFGGGPDWQGISPGWASFPGPQPGEGTHPVSFDLY